MRILNTLPARAKAYIIDAMYGRIINAGSYAFALAGRTLGTDDNTQGVASLCPGLRAGCPFGARRIAPLASKNPPEQLPRESQAFSANRQQIVLHRFRGFVVLCLRIRQIHFTFFEYIKQKMATCWGGWARLGEKKLPLYAGLEVAFDNAPPMRGGE